MGLSCVLLADTDPGMRSMIGGPGVEAQPLRGNAAPGSRHLRPKSVRPSLERWKRRTGDGGHMLGNTGCGVGQTHLWAWVMSVDCGCTRGGCGPGIPAMSPSRSPKIPAGARVRSPSRIAHSKRYRVRITLPKSLCHNNLTQDLPAVPSVRTFARGSRLKSRGMCGLRALRVRQIPRPKRLRSGHTGR